MSSSLLLLLHRSSTVVLFSPSVEKKESARLGVIHRLTSSYIQIFESKKSLKCGHGGIIITRLSGYIVGCIIQNIFSKVQKQSEMSNVYFFVHFQSRVHRAASTASLPNSKWDLRTLVQSWPKAKKSNFSGVDRRGLLRLCSSYSKTPKKFLERNVDL